MPEPSFIPAAELSAAFYAEVVRPLLDRRPHSAALLGWGSDVLVYDTERSTDHGWGPRLTVFLEGATVSTSYPACSTPDCRSAFEDGRCDLAGTLCQSRTTSRSPR